MPESPNRLWLVADLPLPASEAFDLRHYRIVGIEDPIELLRDVHAFIGYEAHVPDLVERVEKVLASFPVAGAADTQEAPTSDFLDPVQPPPGGSNAC